MVLQCFCVLSTTEKEKLYGEEVGLESVDLDLICQCCMIACLFGVSSPTRKSGKIASGEWRRGLIHVEPELFILSSCSPRDYSPSPFPSLSTECLPFPAPFPLTHLGMKSNLGSHHQQQTKLHGIVGRWKVALIRVVGERCRRGDLLFQKCVPVLPEGCSRKNGVRPGF